MTYFDNAATSYYKPNCVINAISAALKHLSANPGRSSHSLSLKCAILINKARENLKDFLGLKNGEIVFNLNCSQSLNFAIFGSVKPGSHIITTAYEHNSVLRPLSQLQKNGVITFDVVFPNDYGIIELNKIYDLVNSSTTMIVTNHVSNVTGAVTNINAIGNMCKNLGILYLVDGAQSVGHYDIDIDKNNVDMLAIAPHKGLNASQGIGALAVKKGVNLRPILFGGTGTNSLDLMQPNELPESLEIGTLPTPAIAGLNAGINYNRENAKNMRQKITALSEYALCELQKLSGIKIYTAKDCYNGIISFNIGELNSGYVADVLSSEYDICVRGGLHCAPLIHKHLGTDESGIVRASLGFDNSFSEVDFLIKAIRDING